MADVQKKLTILPDNPLCGISTYKDTLNLATGVCTRQIKKLVLTGEEGWKSPLSDNTKFYLDTITPDYLRADAQVTYLCTHYISYEQTTSATLVPNLNMSMSSAPAQRLYITDSNYTTTADFKSFLAAQYANGTPVTVWYVLATPTTETITVPTGLSGTKEGYLTQSGTPTPTNPVYPTANEVLIWQHSLRKLGTATETIQSGDTIYADGTAATISLKGNTVQNGTPSPNNHVEVVGVGVRTENLAPEIRSANGWVVGYLNGNDGSYNPNNYNGEWLSPNIPISSGETITISAMSISNPSMSVYYWNGSTFMYGESSNNYSGSSFTTPLNTTHIRIALRAGSDNKTEEAVISSGFWLMLNAGSTAKPYEPYGYKIPISSGGVTTNIYLSEPLYKIGEYADTINSNGTVTRKIKKIIFNGTENWSGDNTKTHYLQDIIMNYPHETKLICCCSHFNGITNVQIGSSIPDGAATFLVEMDVLYLKGFEVSTLSDFKQFLADQYAAGTPVTLWYVLATAESESITAPTIPTTEGANSITVDTTVQPSEFTATWTGWHDASVKEKSKNLFDKTTAIQGKQYNENGVLVDAESNWYGTDYIPVSNNGTYIRSINAYGVGSAYNEYDSQKNFIARYTPTYGTPFTVGENTAYITFSINSTNTNLNDYMLNTGSTALPYEPYWK